MIHIIKFLQSKKVIILFLLTVLTTISFSFNFINTAPLEEYGPKIWWGVLVIFGGLTVFNFYSVYAFNNTKRLWPGIIGFLFILFWILKMPGIYHNFLCNAF